MQKVVMPVKGTTRTVHILRQLDETTFRCKVYVGYRSKTSVSGTLRIFSNGARRFYPDATSKNVDLL